MDKEEAIEKVKQYKLLLNKYFNLDKVYLFGSFVKKTQRTDSDIDVAIVVKKLKGNYFSIYPLLWKLRRMVDDRIEPVLIEKEHDDADFLSEIMKTGIEII